MINDITEKKKAEKQLKEFNKNLEKEINERTNELKKSEEKYRYLFNNSPYSIILLNLKGEIIDYNKTTEKILGFKKGEYTGKKFLNLLNFPPEKSSFLKKKIDINIKGDKKESIQFQIYKEENELIWISLHSSLIKIGNETFIQIFLQNISKRKQAEDELKEKEAKFRSIVENSHDGILIVDNNFRFTYVNEELCKILGYSQNEIIGQDFRKFLDEESINLVSDRYIKRQRGEQVPPLYEFNIIRKNGEKRRVEIKSAIIKVSKGDVRTIAQILDITERKMVEQKLKESQHMLQLVLDNIPQFIFWKNKDSVYMGCNKNFARVAGVGRPENIIGKTDYDLPWTKSEAESFIEIDRLVMETNKPEYHIIESQLQANGKCAWLDVNRIPLHDTEGNVVGILGTYEDITEKKKREILIKKEMKKLKELEQIRKELISRVSHELKTPVAIISGSSELLLTVYKDQLMRDAEELIKVIDNGANRLKELVENLIDVSRIDFKMLQLRKKTYDLCEIIKECIKDFYYLIKKRKIKIILELSEKIYFNVDRIRFAQVINNLISNAIKNTPPEGTIKIILKKKVNSIKIYIKDTGVGLTDSEIKRLFTRFGKIERHEEGLEYSDIQGSGLGLYISKEIINLHGGQIQVKSAGRHKGSTFIIKLPIS